MAMKVIPADKNHRIKYLYDEEATGVRNGYEYKGIVIAILEKDSWEVINELETKGINITGVGHKDYFMNSTFKGISYCSVDDEFDLKKGMKIAKLRAFEKYYRNKRRVIARTFNALSKATFKIRLYHADAFTKWGEVRDELEEFENKSDTEEGGE